MSFIIGFDQAHKERGRISSSLSKLTELLNSNGFHSEEYSEFPIMAQNLRPYDICVFACPDNSRVSRQEIDALKRWVKEDGGGLLLLSHAGGDKGRRSNLSELAEQFGMIFENDQVLDKINNLGVENLPSISEFPFPHPITENVTDVCYRAGCSLSLSSATITPVISSGPNAEPVESPLLLAGEVGEGRVVAIGSYEMFRDRIAGGIKHGSHKQLAINIFSWLRTTKRAQIKGQSSTEASNLPSTEQARTSVPSSPPTFSFNAGPPNTIPSQQKTFESQVKIVANADVFRAFEDALTEMFAFKERMLAEFDILQKNLANLMRAVIATEDDLINVESAQYAPEETTLSQVETFKPPVTVSSPTESPVVTPPKSKKTTKTTKPPMVSQKSKAELEAELESLENKARSIGNLKAFVEKKFVAGKLTEKNYEKQMAKLESDNKKTQKQIEELQESLKKL